LKPWVTLRQVRSESVRGVVGDDVSVPVTSCWARRPGRGSSPARAAWWRLPPAAPGTERQPRRSTRTPRPPADPGTLPAGSGPLAFLIALTVGCRHHLTTPPSPDRAGIGPAAGPPLMLLAGRPSWSAAGAHPTGPGPAPPGSRPGVPLDLHTDSHHRAARRHVPGSTTPSLDPVAGAAVHSPTSGGRPGPFEVDLHTRPGRCAPSADLPGVARCHRRPPNACTWVYAHRHRRPTRMVVLDGRHTGHCFSPADPTGRLPRRPRVRPGTRHRVDHQRIRRLRNRPSTAKTAAGSRATVPLGGEAGKRVLRPPPPPPCLVDVQDPQRGFAVIDTATNTITRRVPLPGCDHDHGPETSTRPTGSPSSPATPTATLLVPRT